MVQAEKQSESYNNAHCLSTTVTPAQSADYPLTLEFDNTIFSQFEDWLPAAENTASRMERLAVQRTQHSNVFVASGQLSTEHISKSAQDSLAFDQLQSWYKLWNRLLNNPCDSAFKIIVDADVNQPKIRWFSAGGIWSDIAPELAEDPILSPAVCDVNGDQSEELSLSSYGDVIERAISLEQKGYLDSALDLIVDTLDELFRRGQFAVCDSILIETNVDACSSDILVTILTVTARAKSHLAVRPDFVERTKQALDDRGDLRSGVLDGLE